MKANELRLGNWIHHKYSEPNFIVSVINTFKENTVNGIELEDCEPIPLTEEWLIRFGFFKDREGDFYIPNFKDNVDFHIMLKQTNVIFTLWSDDPIYFQYEKMYVHSLQNLYFALTGEELTLKL